jgi:hypothetical protein
VLIEVLTKLLNHHPAQITPLDCDDCQEQLPAYIDSEQSQGTASTAQSYPDIWWHLATCFNCAETHQLISILSQSKQQDNLNLLNLRTAMRILPRLELQRSFLKQVLLLNTSAGVAWGHDDHGMVVATDDKGGYQLTLSVKPINHDDCTVTVRLKPPIQGTVVVEFGALMFRIPIDQKGHAQLHAVPIHLLTAANGSNMVISVEADVGTPE